MTTPNTQTTATALPAWTTLADTAVARAYPGGSTTTRSGIGAPLAAMRQAVADGATHGERLRNRDLADWDIPDDDVPDDISDLIAEAGLEDEAQPSGVPAAEVITTEDIAQALRVGDDPWAMDSGTISYRPPLAVDPGDVTILARLAKTFATQEAVNAALCDGAATVLLCASDAEAHRTARVLKSALRFSGDATQTPPAPQVVVFDEGCLATASNRARAQDRITDPAPLLVVSTVPPASLPGALAHLPDVTLASHCADTLLWTLRRTHSATGKLAEAAVRDALPDDAALVQLTQDRIDLSLRAIGPLSVARKLAELAVDQIRGPKLADLPGLGAAGDQLAQIAEDVAAYRAGKLPWSDVTNGILLSGAPGTGKTTVAAALARTLGVPLIATSLGDWQEEGSGGRNVIKAIIATFAGARAAASRLRDGVAIILIDEIDSVQSREGKRDHNSSYFTSLNNELLKQLHGAIERDGVLVIGATNHPERLDPALTRWDRLGMHIAIGHPTARDLPAVLRYHLGSDLADLDLARIARAASGLSMAEARGLVQEARQMARAETRPMVEDDLFAVLTRTRMPLSEALRRRAATYAAARAVAAHVTGSARPDALRLAGAAASVDLTRRTDARTRADIGRKLVTLLAGRAAEEDMCGTPSGLGGGDAGSDLAQATRLAIREALSYGHGSLVWCEGEGDPTTLFARHPGLRDRVASRLDGAYARARNLIRANCDAVVALSGHLAVDGVVDTDTMRDLLIYCVDQPRPAPDGPDADGGIWLGM